MCIRLIEVRLRCVSKSNSEKWLSNAVERNTISIVAQMCEVSRIRSSDAINAENWIHQNAIGNQIFLNLIMNPIFYLFPELKTQYTAAHCSAKETSIRLSSTLCRELDYLNTNVSRSQCDAKSYEVSIQHGFLLHKLGTIHRQIELLKN